jgi:hypothetical protein
MNNTTNTTNPTPFKVIIPVKLNGETRDVEFFYWKEDDQKATAYGFGAKIGHGTKLHGTWMTAWLRNGVWVPSTATCVLNRQATIVAFADQGTEQGKSKHVGSKIR